MKTSDIHVNQKFYDKNKIIRTVASVNDKGFVTDTDGNKYVNGEIKPITGHVYTETDDYGHISLCLETALGIMVADADQLTDAGYSAMYLSIKGKHEDAEKTDIAAIKNAWDETMFGLKAENDGNVPNRNLEVKIWRNLGSLETTETFTIPEAEVLECIKDPDDDRVYTHDVAANIAEIFENILDKHGIRVPSPEDAERDPDDKSSLYGSTYSDMLDAIEKTIVTTLKQAGTSKDKYVTDVFSGKY